MLPGVRDEIRDFRSRRIVGVADVAGDADPLGGDWVERDERLARAVVRLRELVQLAGADVIDRRAEAAIARQAAQVLQGDPQQRGVLGPDRPDDDIGPVGQQNALPRKPRAGGSRRAGSPIGACAFADAARAAATSFPSARSSPSRITNSRSPEPAFVESEAVAGVYEVIEVVEE